MTDKINNFIEEANTNDLLQAYREAKHQDEKNFIFAEIENRYHNHDCGKEQGCKVCDAYYLLTH